jgi:type IX secretion system PorP/SprF family membrane protein
MKNINHTSRMVGLLILAASTLMAQQSDMYQRYLFNTLALTPAYAGSHEQVRVVTQVRKQWVGTQGAPTSGLISADGVSRDTRAGWGFLAGYESVGLYQNTDIHGNYAYRIALGEGHFSMGIRVGGTLYQYRSSDVNLSQGNDPLYQQNAVVFVPKMGLGFLFYSNRWFAGVSAPDLAAIRLKGEAAVNNDRLLVPRHYFAHVGYSYQLEQGVQFKPTMLIRYAHGDRVQADFNAQVYVNNRCGLGLGYRTGDSFTFLCEFFPTDQIAIGYSYNAVTNQLSNFGANAHEVVLSYKLAARQKVGE